jgi:16S rRNA C967 or C1407 C5-methylase (RsmB/RsmF family)
MGKGRKRTFKRNEKRGKGGKGTDEWNSDSRGKAPIKENAQLELFYKRQAIVPEGEWDAFMAAMRASLPSCFRVPNGRYAEQTRAVLRKDTFGLAGLDTGAEFEGHSWVAQPPTPVEWLPDGYAWTSNIPRPLIRKSTKLKELHQWLIAQNASGNINRQEAVSMIPPMLLDVQPGHYVLDTCAAPGSKTAQLVDSLHRNGRLNAGLLIANDADSKRAYMLTHQLKRFIGDSVLVTNHQAQRFPKLRPKGKEREAAAAASATGGDGGIEFDRVLCDVPCCGDGTVRKAPEMWRKWNYGMGAGLHKLQLAILIRGLELLKVGGRLVYSTCTMNPYENEAVLAEAVRRFSGKVKLVDTTADLPNLKRQPGLLTWGVRDTKAEGSAGWLASHEDVPAHLKDKMPPTLWPPATTEEAEALGLQHALRLLPHYHDTGAFFVCAMTKVEPTLPGHDYGLGREDEPSKQSKKQQQASAGASAAAAAAGATGGTKRPAAAAAPRGSGATGGGAAKKPMTVTKLRVTASGETQTTVAISTSIDPQDWKCAACGRSNYHNRTECYKCHAPQGSDQPPVGPSGFRRGGGQDKSDDYVLVPPEIWETDASLREVKTFYGLTDDFPYDCIVRRGAESSSKLFLVSRAVKGVLEMDTGKQLKLISAGIKVLHYSRKTNVKDQDAILTDYRLCQESVGMIRTLLGRQRVVQLNLKDFAKMVNDKMADKRTQISAENFTTGTDALKTLQAMEPGSCVMELIEEKKAAAAAVVDPICVTCWRGKEKDEKGSLNLFVTKQVGPT